ncbi:MAG: ATP-binding protein [bacterium]|nr:ATP-binding protein [bacterium]
MELKFNDDNTPNAGKFITSLRKVGYDNYSALMDIVDNSVDAGAGTVEISVYHRNKEVEFLIVDDGSGMESETLNQALRLGSDTEKMSGSLGKFGMGLSTASLSLCRRTAVYSKPENENQWHVGVIDTDEIVAKNRFVRAFGLVDSREVAGVLKEGNIALKLAHGTVVHLSLCDQVQNSNTTVFATILKGRLGQTYRQFIENGLKLVVNGSAVVAEDPLFRKTKGTEMWIDDWFDIETPGGKEKVILRVALIPDFGAAGNKGYGINIPNQGVYVLRNNREIAAGWWPFSERKHGDFNRFRAEIIFSTDLDDVMGVNFSKRGIEPTQSAVDQIKRVLEPQLTGVRQRAKKAQQATGEDIKVSHTEAEKQISGKAALLAKPTSTKIKGDEKESKEKSKHPDVDKKPKEPRHPGTPGPICRFEHRHMTAAGVLFEPYQEGRVTVIAWNVDHPFYERFLSDYAGERAIISAVDFLIYSFAVAELREASDEDKLQLLINLRSVLSSNLRILLS